MIVCVCRELDLMHEFLLGNGVAANENPLVEFAALTITNAFVGAVWPRFLYATLGNFGFAGVIAGYLAIILWLYLSDRPNSSIHRPTSSSPLASPHGHLLLGPRRRVQHRSARVHTLSTPRHLLRVSGHVPSTTVS